MGSDHATATKREGRQKCLWPVVLGLPGTELISFVDAHTIVFCIFDENSGDNGGNTRMF